MSYYPPPPPGFRGPPVGGAYPRAQRPSSNSTLWIVLGVVGGCFCALIVGLAILGIVLAPKSDGGTAPTKTSMVKAPPDGGWPMEFYAGGVTARTFTERQPDGSNTTVGISVHAPKPFLEQGISSFAFEVCRLVDGERSNWHCDVQSLFVNPQKKTQKDGVRSYTIKEGPGVYQARLVEFGTFGADDKIYSSATFEVH